MITSETITWKQIEQLREEAAKAGDVGTVEICDRATLADTDVEDADLGALASILNAADAQAEAVAS